MPAARRSRRWIPGLALALAATAAPAAAQPAVPPPDPPPPVRPKIGVVFSGGGAKGCAHIGVLRVLEEMRIPVDYAAGTSMGAIVGGPRVGGAPAGPGPAAVTEPAPPLPGQPSGRRPPTADGAHPACARSSASTSA